MNLYPTTETMPLKVYIHIGAPKTGTSAIQSHINTNRRWLAERGIYVPKAGYLSSYGHCKLFSKSELGPGLARLMPFLPEDGELDELGREISKCKELNFTTVLLTWEGFSLIDQQLISKLGRCLGECEIDVLSYVREQAKLYQSTVLQFIESNNGFARSFFPPPEFNSIEFRDYLNFHELLTSWKATLPEGTGIRSRVYNLELLNGGNIVLDFIDFIGLKYSSGFCLQRDSVNTSIDYSAAVMLAVFETVGANPAQREQLVHAFTQAGRYSNTSTSEFLSQETVTKIAEHFKLSNQELIRDYPPENCDQSLAEHYLAGLQRSKELDVDPVIEFCRSVLSALSSSSAYLWHGQPLSGHTLRRITGGSSSGWGPSDVKGIWSWGEKSDVEVLEYLPA